MTTYTADQLTLVLGRARREALRLRKTVHVIKSTGLFARFKGPFEIVETLRSTYDVVIRDVHPRPMTDAMVTATRQALDHSPERAAVMMAALRAIKEQEDGTPLSLEETAELVWRLAEELTDADNARRIRFA